MPSRRSRRDINVKGILRDVDDTLPPITIIRDLMKDFGVNLARLEVSDSDDEVESSASKVTYEQVAPLVGLEHYRALTDIGTFELHRSRIPTNLFKSIVTDMDMMLMQYGPPYEHNTVEARSMFYSPVLNHLVKQFNFMLRNEPEVVAGDDGCIGTQGHIQHIFKAFGVVTMLFVEKRLKVDNNDNRLEAIAQIIAEANDLDLDNKSSGHSLPIHCVISYGRSFEFFKFERKPNPTFTRGCFPGDPSHLRRGLILQNLEFMETSLPFILNLGPICETIFDMMLCAYIESLKASYARLVQDKGKYRDSKWSSLDGWDEAIKLAECALVAFRKAEDERNGGDFDAADGTVDQALPSLQYKLSANYIHKLPTHEGLGWC